MFSLLIMRKMKEEHSLSRGVGTGGATGARAPPVLAAPAATLATTTDVAQRDGLTDRDHNNS